MSRSKPIKQDSPSKRLRNVFYGLFEKDNEGFESFEPYYDSKMEKLIKHYSNLKSK